VCQQGNITAFLPFGQNTTIVTLIGGEKKELPVGEFQMTFEYEFEQICSYYVFVRGKFVLELTCMYIEFTSVLTDVFVGDVKINYGSSHGLRVKEFNLVINRKSWF